MASLIASGGIRSISWQIVGLSNPFNTTYYVDAGVAWGPITDGQTSPPNYFDFETAPQSNTSTSTSGTTVPGITPGTWTIYAWTYTPSGRYWSAGSATVVVSDYPPPPPTSKPCIYHNGAWVGKPTIYHNGAWHDCTPSIYSGGSWKT